MVNPPVLESPSVQFWDTTNHFKTLDRLGAIPLKLHWITAPVLPYIAQYRKTNAVGRCDESAQSVMQDPLCARALPYQSHKE